MKPKNEKNVTLDILVQMVARGFENTATKDDVNELRGGFNGLKVDVHSLKEDVHILQTDVSDIKLRLDSLAPKFEVRDLEKRVTRLEHKVGFRNKI